MSEQQKLIETRPTIRWNNQTYIILAHLNDGFVLAVPGGAIMPAAPVVISEQDVGPITISAYMERRDEAMRQRIPVRKLSDDDLLEG